MFAFAFIKYLSYTRHCVKVCGYTYKKTRWFLLPRRLYSNKGRENIKWTWKGGGKRSGVGGMYPYMSKVASEEVEHSRQ